MRDARDLVRAIKKVTVESERARYPVAVMFGTVTSADPLRVTLEQKLQLDKEQLIVPDRFAKLKVQHRNGEHVTEYEIDNSLGVGDAVVLVRMQGGQRFLIMDRVVV